jgi:GNAT superfamily N-acetyltransferase
MTFPVLTQEVAARIERCLAEAGEARRRHVAGLPDNPLDFQVRRFEHIEAVACRRPVAHYGYFSGLRGVRSGDGPLLEAPLAWLREQGVAPSLSVSPFFADDALLADLARLGLRASGFMSVLYGRPDQPSEPGVPMVSTPTTPATPGTGDGPVAAPGGDSGAAVTVERVDASDAGGFRPFLDVWLAGRTDDRALRERLLRAELRDWWCYVAFSGGRPAGVGAMCVTGDAAHCAAATTLPEWRGRGCQTALLRRRLADAAAAGRDLVVVQAKPGSQSQRNLERAGLRTAYTSVSFAG